MVCHRLDLRGVTSLQEIIDRGQEYVKQADLAPGEWIIGYGFDHNSFDPPTLPDRGHGGGHFLRPSGDPGPGLRSHRGRQSQGLRAGGL